MFAKLTINQFISNLGQCLHKIPCWWIFLLLFVIDSEFRLYSKFNNNHLVLLEAINWNWKKYLRNYIFWRLTICQIELNQLFILCKIDEICRMWEIKKPEKLLSNLITLLLLSKRNVCCSRMTIIRSANSFEWVCFEYLWHLLSFS